MTSPQTICATLQRPLHCLPVHATEDYTVAIHNRFLSNFYNSVFFSHRTREYDCTSVYLWQRNAVEKSNKSKPRCTFVSRLEVFFVVIDVYTPVLQEPNEPTRPTLPFMAPLKKTLVVVDPTVKPTFNPVDHIEPRTVTPEDLCLYN